MTGYIDPPAGVEIREGMHYNPFFPGGAISMARVLFDGLVEYDDGTTLFSYVLIHSLKRLYFLGTEATASQMAKDVVTFLSWAAEPEHDERKKLGIKAVIIFSTLFVISVYVKRFKWGPIKNRKICRCQSDMPKLLRSSMLQSTNPLLTFTRIPPFYSSLVDVIYIETLDIPKMVGQKARFCISQRPGRNCNHDKVLDFSTSG